MDQVCYFREWENVVLIAHGKEKKVDMDATTVFFTNGKKIMIKGSLSEEIDRQLKMETEEQQKETEDA